MIRDLTPLPEVVEAFRDLWPHIVDHQIKLHKCKGFEYIEEEEDYREVTGSKAEHTIKILIPEGFNQEQQLIRHFIKYRVEDEETLPSLTGPVVIRPGLPVFTGTLRDDGSCWCVLTLWRLWRIKQANKNKLPA